MSKKILILNRMMNLFKLQGKPIGVNQGKLILNPSKQRLLPALMSFASLFV